MRPDCTVVEAALLSAPGIGALTDARHGSRAPVLVVDCPSDSRLRAHWLNAGVADCLSQPYCSEEFAARVMALLRRARPSGVAPVGRSVTRGDVTIDRVRRTVEVRGEVVSLTPTEFALLSYLLDHPDTFLTREQLLASVWGYTFGGQDTVTVHVRRLRKKIELDPGRPQLIRTVWGARGYRFMASVMAGANAENPSLDAGAEEFGATTHPPCRDPSLPGQAQAVPVAEAAAGPQPRRMVSLGYQPIYIDDPSRKANGRPQRVDVELLYDYDHPSQRYHRMPHGVLEPLQDTHGKEDQAEALGVVDPKAWGHSGMRGDAPAETVTPVA